MIRTGRVAQRGIRKPSDRHPVHMFSEENSYDSEEFICGQLHHSYGVRSERTDDRTGFRSDRTNETRRLSARRIYHRGVEGNFEENAQTHSASLEGQSPSPRPRILSV